MKAPSVRTLVVFRPGLVAVLGGALMLTAVGCGDGSEPTVTPAPIATMAPAATAAPPTPPAPTNTPAPVAAPAPTTAPAPTATPAPTASPVPTNTPVPTSTPAPTPSIDVQFVTKWGSWGSEEGQFREPYDITLDRNGNLYVADMDNNAVQYFSPEGQFLGKWGSPAGMGALAGSVTGVVAGEGEVRLPSVIASDGEGHVYVMDLGTGGAYGNLPLRVVKFTEDGTFVAQLGEAGEGAGQFESPRGIAFDRDDNIYVVDAGQGQVQVFTPEGESLRAWGEKGSEPGSLHGPSGMAIGNDGLVYVVEGDAHRVQVFTTEGEFVRGWGKIGREPGEFRFPSDIALDEAGNVYVADSLNDRVQVFNSQGELLGAWGTLGTGDGEFTVPTGIALSPVDGGRVRVWVVEGGWKAGFGRGGVYEGGSRVQLFEVTVG